MATINVSNSLINSLSTYSISAGATGNGHICMHTDYVCIPTLHAGSTDINNDLTITGNLTVLGSCTLLNTTVSTTSAMFICNSGTGPALQVIQSGSQPVALFTDQECGTSLCLADNGVATFGQSVNIYNTNYNYGKRLSVGRCSDESIYFEINDSNNCIIANQDETDQDHAFYIDRQFSTSTCRDDFHISKCGTPQLTVDISGNVGIGTINPVGKFSVKPNGSYPGQMSIGTYAPLGVGPVLKISQYNSTADANSYKLGLYNNHTLALLSLDDTVIFSVNNTGFYLPRLTINGAGSVYFPSIALDSTIGDESGFYVPGGLGSKTIGFITDRLERMRIDMDGNVGIGTTDPTYKLDVSGDGRFTSDILVNSLIVGKGGGNVNSNTALGINALLSNTTGFNNVAAGNNALCTNTTGSINTATGASSLRNNTTGNYNIATGSYSLYSNTTGSCNIATGSYSLYSNTTGGCNIATGYQALCSNTSGYNNIATGRYSLCSNTTGASNIATGIDSLRFNTTGASNIATGSYSLHCNTTGNNNIAVGARAGYNLNSTGNVVIGYDTGCTITTGTYNTLLGYNAQTLNATDTNSIVIGYNATGLGSNTISLGNSNITKTIINSGNVGIGTTTPNEKLHVYGSQQIENGSLYFKNSTQHGFIPFPDGAWYDGSSISTTGAIKISLPVISGTPADMMSFWVDIFDYTTNETVSLYIAGYNYQAIGGSTWVNPTAIVFSKLSTKNYTVRFGDDGTNKCIWIGETSSTWSYPQVVVRDFQGGHNTNISDYKTGWSIDIVASLGTVDETVSGNFPQASNADTLDGQEGSYYLDSTNLTGTIPSASLTGTYDIDISGDADTVDGYHASDIINNIAVKTSATTDLAIGWYTIAVVTGTHERAIARFGIRDERSGKHQSIVFYASHHYGNDTSNHLFILSNSFYGPSDPFTKIRIKENGTYDGAVLQVYVAQAVNDLTAYILGDNFQSSGWTLKNFIPDATDPGGVANYGNFTTKAEIDFDGKQHSVINAGPMYAGTQLSQSRVLTVNDEGSGNGLDADLLDGLHSSSFVRSDTDDNLDGRYTILNQSTTIGGSNWDNGWLKIGNSSVGWSIDSNEFYNSGDGIIGTLKTGGNINFAFPSGGTLTRGGNLIWDAGNDGTGSGLDADLLDGQHGSYYLSAGSLSGTENYIPKFSGTNSINNSVIYQDASGSIGVGTTDPTYKLDVSGDGRFTSDILVNSLTVGKGGGNVSTNTTLGVNALSSNTTGNCNIAIGYQSLYSNTTGGCNIATGYQSLYSNVSGSDNIASGFYSLVCNTTGSQNVAIGTCSLHSNTTCFNNTAIGYSALKFNKSSNNTAIGSSSLCSLSGVNATGNTAIGMASICSNTSGLRNTGVGLGVLLNSTTGCNNVALGAYAGDTLTTGSNNIIIGYNADVAATDSNSIVIGCGATGLGDNSIVIGNSSITKTCINSTYVGIGTDPAAKFHVDGNCASSYGLFTYDGINNAVLGFFAGCTYSALYWKNNTSFRLGTSTGITGSGFSERMVFDTSNVVFNEPGNNINFRVEAQSSSTGPLADKAYALFVSASAGAVGIGTSQPSYALEVDGTAHVTGTFTAGTKSFLIDHPTKENYLLQYGSLEGPENGVYVRGSSASSTISLPEYWTGLVEEDSITVTLTPRGKFLPLYIEDIKDYIIYVGGTEIGSLYDYVVYGTRKDVDNLLVEFERPVRSS